MQFFSGGRNKDVDVDDDAHNVTADTTVTTTTTTPNQSQQQQQPQSTISQQQQSFDNQYDDSPDRNNNNMNACLAWATKGDRSLIIVAILLVVLMNVRFGRIILYPFTIFATWVHEMCHGLAALMVGGEIDKLQIFGNGSGLAHLVFPGDTPDKRIGMSSSAGYPGTSIFGGLLLLCRKTDYGPLIGIVSMGALLILSCLLYVRNVFGTTVLFAEGVFLLAAAALLYRTPNKRTWLCHLYNCCALTMCLNAVSSITVLFGDHQATINGQDLPTDAHSTATLWGGHYKLWALAWLLLSLVCTVLGIWLAPDTRSSNSDRQRQQQNQANANSNANTPTNGSLQLTSNSGLDVTYPTASPSPTAATAFEADRV